MAAVVLAWLARGPVEHTFKKSVGKNDDPQQKAQGPSSNLGRGPIFILRAKHDAPS